LGDGAKSTSDAIITPKTGMASSSRIDMTLHHHVLSHVLDYEDV
jgi:hypothetical protein